MQDLIFSFFRFRFLLPINGFEWLRFVVTTENNGGAGRMTRQRRMRVAELVRERGAMRVSELARELNTSEVTIRSDLTRLESEGLLIRDHGGAISSERQVTSLLAVEARAQLRLEEKRRIARAAAEFVKPGDTILMDAGTTVVEMAPYLSDVRELSVVTYALNVVLQMGAQTDARILLLGGAFNRESSSTLGPITERQLADLKVQKLFLGTQAFDLDQGLTDTTIEIAQIKQRMISSAHEVILLSDSGKWGKTGFIKVAPLTDVGTIISDSGLDSSARTALESLGVKVLTV